MISVITVGFHSENDMLTLNKSIGQIKESVELLFHDNTRHNIGLSKAVNQLLTQAHGDLVLFCNPDVKFGEEINAMIDNVRQFGQPQTPMYIGLNVDRRFPTTMRILASHTFVGRLFSHHGVNPIDRDYCNVGDRVEQPGGSFLMMPKHIAEYLAKPTFYDEQFPVYWNDVDLAMRAKAENIRVYKSATKVFHTGAVSSQKISLETRLALFYGKHGLIGFVEKWSMHPRLVRFVFFLDTIVAVIFDPSKLTILRCMLQ